mmetsp:Transcript_79042/g.189880  ORF Transcript_79042/g.189880 Transcript_79042/m.189880 type:complete len:227 (-) Transcript_79042:27-707(-)
MVRLPRGKPVLGHVLEGQLPSGPGAAAVATAVVRIGHAIEQLLVGKHAGSLLVRNLCSHLQRTGSCDSPARPTRALVDEVRAGGGLGGPVDGLRKGRGGLQEAAGGVPPRAHALEAQQAAELLGGVVSKAIQARCPRALRAPVLRRHPGAAPGEGRQPLGVGHRVPGPAQAVLLQECRIGTLQALRLQRPEFAGGDDANCGCHQYELHFRDFWTSLNGMELHLRCF